MEVIKGYREFGTSEVSYETYQDRGEWLKARRRGVGGSDAPRILGLTGENGAADVWIEKVAQSDPDVESSERAKWGLRFERPIVEGYGEDSGRTVHLPPSRMIVRSVAHPFLAFSPDGWQECDEFEGPGIIQAKNVDANRREDWLEGAPEKYVTQIQHEMMVEGRKWGTLVAVFGGNECAWFDVMANPDFQAALLETEADFWDHVTRGVCPKVDPLMKSALKTLKRLYPTAEKSTITIPGARWCKALDDLNLLEAEADEIQSKIDALKAAFQAEMKSSEAALLDDGRRLTWKTTNRKAYEVKASSYRVFRVPKS